MKGEEARQVPQIVYDGLVGIVFIDDVDMHSSVFGVICLAEEGRHVRMMRDISSCSSTLARGRETIK